MARSRGLGEVQFLEKLNGTPIPRGFLSGAGESAVSDVLPEESLIMIQPHGTDIFLEFGSSPTVEVTPNTGVFVANGEQLVVSLAPNIQYFAAMAGDGTSTFTVTYFELV
jgi:hypothetical protein